MFKVRFIVDYTNCTIEDKQMFRQVPGIRLQKKNELTGQFAFSSLSVKLT